MEVIMKLRPIEDHVVVQIAAAAQEKTIGGIIIPDTAKEKPQIAEIVAVGTDKTCKRSSRWAIKFSMANMPEPRSNSTESNTSFFPRATSWQ